MLSTLEVLGWDSAPLSPPEQSFYSEDFLLQHCSELRPQTPLESDDYLIQGFEDIRNFLGVNELDLYNEPELSLVAMDKEVTTQMTPKDSVVLEYGFESSALLSPVSIEPPSPAQGDGIACEDQLELIAENGEYLDSILEMFSVDSNDSQSQEQCYDSDLSVQAVIETEVEEPEEPKTIGSVDVLRQERPKRQLKRKVTETEEQLPKPKANKRTKKTLTEKKERKRSQNKDAANRYRLKKRKELETIDDQQKRFEDRNSELRAQLQKLQMEFKVVYPLAKAAFAKDLHKNLELQALDLRVVKENLLD